MKEKHSFVGLLACVLWALSLADAVEAQGFTILADTKVTWCDTSTASEVTPPSSVCTVSGDYTYSQYLSESGFTESCLESIEPLGLHCDADASSHSRCKELVAAYPYGPGENQPRLCKPGPGGESAMLALGPNDPSCGEGGLSLSVGGEYPVTHRLSFELELGQDDLDLHRAPEGVDVNHALVGLRGYLRPWRRIHPFGTLGAGIYDLEPGPTEEGYSFGLGVQYELSRRLAVEALSRYHRVGVEGPDVDFTTFQVGIRGWFSAGRTRHQAESRSSGRRFRRGEGIAADGR